MPAGLGYQLYNASAVSNPKFAPHSRQF